MNVLIVEDETPAYNNLKALLGEIDYNIEILGVTESVTQTVRWLKKNKKPDLIFMDIHLSDGSAFNIFTVIEVESPIVFITAYDEYALNAFKVNSIDYLLKPINAEQLRRALSKFYKLTNADMLQYMSRLSNLNISNTYIERVLIPIQDKLYPVELDNVSCFYTTDNHTRIFLKDGTTYSYSRSLDSIMPSLNPLFFFRANKQFIVSKKNIKDITVWFDNRLLLTLDIELPERIYISKNKASIFRKWMIE